MFHLSRGPCMAGCLVLLIVAGSALAEVGMSDQDFFASLGLDRPGLGAVKDAAATGDYVRARLALVLYYQQRTSPVPGREILIKHDASFDTQSADLVAKHVFTREAGSFFLGDRVDWSAQAANVNGQRNREFSSGINRHGGGSLGALAAAYENTGQERYAESFVELIGSWIEDVPMPAHEHVAEHHYAWSPLPAGLRLSGWTDFWFLMQHSPAFTPDAQIAMLKAMIVHGRWLASDDCNSSGNWVFMINTGLGSLSVLFPEFKESSRWARIASDRIAAAYRGQIYPDGMQEELTPHYHWVSIVSVKRLLDVMQRNGLPEPPAIAQARGRMLDVTMYLSDPHGFNPRTNDCDMIDVRPTLVAAADALDRPDMRYVGSGFSEGVAPRFDSYGLPYAGLYVTRDGWSKDARWLLFDAGPLGAGHVHQDALNVELFAFGRPLLFDSTNDNLSYQHTAFRWYQMQTEAHNTVMLDGLGQDRIHVQPSVARTAAPLPNRWVTAAGFDYVVGRYENGYRDTLRIKDPRFIDAQHTRTLVFVKPDYWLVSDVVTGSGSHDVQTLWHLTPTELQIDATTQSLHTSHSDGNLLIVPSRAAGLHLNTLAGYKHWRPGIPTDINDTDFGTYDMQGWGAFGQQQPAIETPTAVYEINTALPYSGEYLLFPYRGADPAAASVRRLDAEIDGLAAPADQAVGLQVDWSGGRDIVCLNRDPASTAGFGDVRCDARFAQIRWDDGGRLHSFGLVDGSALSHTTQPLVQADQPLDALDVRLSGDQAYVTLTNPEQIQRLELFAPDIKHVQLNGLDVAFQATGDRVVIDPQHAQPQTRQDAIATGEPEKVLIASQRGGEAYREFTNRAGLCVQAPASAGVGQAQSATVTLFNQTLPQGAQVTLAVDVPLNPGRTDELQWQQPPPLAAFAAPAAGEYLTQTLNLQPSASRLNDLVGGGRAGLHVQMAAGHEGRSLSQIAADVAVTAVAAPVTDRVVFDEAHASQLQEHRVDAKVHNREGNFGGPAGNQVAWTCQIPEAGLYVLKGVFTAGAERKCKLSYSAGDLVVDLPEIGAEQAARLDRYYLVELPAGPIQFTWRSTGGWSYIHSLEILDVRRAAAGIHDDPDLAWLAEQRTQSARMIDRLIFDQAHEAQLAQRGTQINVHSREDHFGGPEGNSVKWQCIVPKRGVYTLTAVFMAGGERHCRLSYSAGGRRVELPDVTAEQAEVLERSYEVDLPAGPVTFEWRSTAGWSYIHSFTLFEGEARKPVTAPEAN